jgi:hypothetical protein
LSSGADDVLDVDLIAVLAALSDGQPRASRAPAAKVVLLMNLVLGPFGICGGLNVRRISDY